MNLRSLRESDIPVVAQVWFEGWHDGHASIVPAELTALRTLENFADRLRLFRPRCIVALEGDMVLGFVATQKSEIYQLFVDRAARGKGVAAALLAAGEDRYGPKAIRALGWIVPSATPVRHDFMKRAVG